MFKGFTVCQLLFVLLLAGQAKADSSCLTLFSTRTLPDARFETDKLETHLSQVKYSDTEIDMMIDEVLSSANKGTITSEFGGINQSLSYRAGTRISGRILDLLQEHSAEFVSILKKRFPNKKVDIDNAQIRVTNEGHFDVPYFHVDLGGFEKGKFSTSTTFNSDSDGTLIAPKGAIMEDPSHDSNTKHADRIPMSFKRYNSNSPTEYDLVSIDGFYIDGSKIVEAKPREIVIVARANYGQSDWDRTVSGGRGSEIKNSAIKNSGPWHASPGYLQNIIKNPRRLWIGINATISD